jgi:hypothetical protein
MAQAVRLWRSNRNGKPRGFWLASWRESGKRVSFNTRTLDKDEAQAKALAELGRRLQAPSAAPDSLPEPTQAPAPSPQLDEGPAAAAVMNGHRKPLTDVLARAFSAGSPLNGATPAPPPAGPLEPSEAATDEEARRKSKKMYQVFGKAMALLTEGSLRRAFRWADREPEEMDDDEIALIREGWEEKGADWFGKTTIGPWGKIAMGTAVAGVGMWIGSKPIERPKPKALPAAPPKPEPRKDGGSA